MGTRLDLAGKVAVVTGVTRHAGIGAAIARDLVGAGAAVFTTHFREYDKRQTWGVAPDEPESILVALGAQAAGIELDLSNPSAAVALFNQANSRFGRVDILVNNAAHWESGGINQASAEELDRHYAVNLRAPVLLCSEFARRRPPSVGGRIINVTSGQGRGPMPGELAYAVTKAGLDALTLSLAADLKTSGVTVNAIDPGPIDTGWMTADLRASLAAASPSGSLARPEDLAIVVRLLCGDAAASITGRIIRIQAEGAMENLKIELANNRLQPSALARSSIAAAEAGRHADYMAEFGHDSPEDAAMDGFPKAHCRVVASRTLEDDAYVLLDTGPPDQPYLYGSSCHRRDGRWFEAGSANCPGWEQSSHEPDLGTLSSWAAAADGVDTVRVEFEGTAWEAPVRHGAYLLIWWRVPAPTEDPRIVAIRENGAWKPVSEVGFAYRVGRERG